MDHVREVRGRCTGSQKQEYFASEPQTLRMSPKNPGTIQAADEVEEGALHHLLHHQKGRGSALPSPHQFSLAKGHLPRALAAQRLFFLQVPVGENIRIGGSPLLGQWLLV